MKTIIKVYFIGIITPLMFLVSCATKYEVSGVERSRILIDSRYDEPKDASLEAFLAPYKSQVDSIMSPVMGKIARNMDAHRPESELSNLLSDILVWGCKHFNEVPDFAVYNMGGIRAAFAKGDVTRGDILDVAPFVNKLCICSLSGDKVIELFQQMAAYGGQGVSHGVQLVITRDGKLKSARLNGQDIDLTKKYRVATLDYLAQGNDGLVAFKDKTDLVASEKEEYNVRYIIEDYFQTAMKAGQTVDSKVEGRIVLEQ